MKALRRPIVFVLMWFFCLGLKDGWADVRTYEPYTEKGPGEEFTIGDRECVDYVRENRPDFKAEISYVSANGMLAKAKEDNVRFKVDTMPEKGAVIYFKYEDSGHVGIIQEITSLPSGKYKLTIMDNNFVAAKTIGKADYTYNPATGRLEKLDYRPYWGTKHIVVDPVIHGDKYSDVKFIHENEIVNDKFNQHGIEPSTDQLIFLSRKVLQGENIASRFNSVENAYYTFGNYGPYKYLHSKSDGIQSWQILLKKFEISTDGSNWIVLGEGDCPIDVAQASRNQTILANYASNSNIPPGTYRYYRFTFGAQYTIKGYAVDPITGYTYYTTSAFEQSSQPTDDSRTGRSSTASGQYDACSLKANTYSTDPGFWAPAGGNYFTWTQTFTTPFQVTTGTKKITLTFNIGNGIAFVPNGWGYSGVMFDMGGDLLPVVETQ